ncbi:LysE family translocator [Paraherbaspirillum soli]|uniref:LysE family translocator n=1 Tax=Paraherbaspirillum soli TaxID=631222 RepID=A0ABW0M744_9BURK
MDYPVLLLYVFSVVALISTPGPVVMLVMNASLQQGPVHGLKTILGTNAASLVLIAITALVINQVFAINAFLLTVLKALGCLYLIYIALDGLWHVYRTRSVGIEPVGGEQRSKDAGFQKGFMVGISNPKDIIFFASFFPQFISISPNRHLSLSILTVVWIALDLAILSFYVFLMSQKKIKRYKTLIILLSSLCLLLVAMIGLVYSVRELLA